MGFLGDLVEVVLNISRAEIDLDFGPAVIIIDGSIGFSDMSDRLLEESDLAKEAGSSSGVIRNGSFAKVAIFFSNTFVVTIFFFSTKCLLSG